MRTLLTEEYLSTELENELVFDETVTHLFARKRPRAGVVFAVRARIDERIVDKVLGHYPSMSIDGARAAALLWLIDQKVLVRRKQLGRAPAEIPAPTEQPQTTCPKCLFVIDPTRAWVDRMTLEQLFETYYSDHVSIECRTKKNIKENFRRYFEPLRTRPAEAITPYEVFKWHKTLTASVGAPTANRSLQLLRTTMNYGIRWQLIDCRNPALATRKKREIARDRVANEDEMPVLLAAIEQHATIYTRDAFKLALMLAQRIQNICGMRWCDVNLKNAVWRIPAEDFKNGNPLDVPLIPEAVEILTFRKANNPKNSPYGFPGRRDSRTHMKWPYKSWHAMLKKAGLKDLRPHDLRRTHGSNQAANNENIATIGRTLGHRDWASTKVYTPLSVDVIRAAMVRAYKRMQRKP